MDYSQTLFENSNAPVGIPLSRYTAAISDTVARAYHLSGVWVTAELSDVRTSAGHCYMELIEKNEAGQTVAKLRANIWRTTYMQLRQKFYNATQRDISNGIKALVKGSATHHPLYGLSFNISDIDPSYTLGDMERLRREILLKLQQEGVLFNNKNIPLPMASQRIAVISAEGAAGYGDFMNHLTGNSEGFVFYPCLFPCMMQGERVSESIRNALESIESTIDFWDCVVIVRGGGATTDLNGFDDYKLARAVATFKLPIIVGIGHERDRNVLDEIAHTSLKTPTAVAGFFIDQARNAYERVLNLTDRIRVSSSELMIGEERRLSSMQSLIPQLAIRSIENAKANLHSISTRLPLLTQGKVGNERVKLQGIVNMLSHTNEGRIAKEKLRIDNHRHILQNILTLQIERGKQQIENLESLIRVLDPRNTLKRGYSVTRVNGKAVKSQADLSPGDIMTTSFCDGEVKSTVCP
ncbi:MAG: exodeoxyribonuclease VII large subunit [Muribaculaceae bacterium]|nr:exodeoxyribonuclease VII large subunit [Muribaculaceae bacterium]